MKFGVRWPARVVDVGFIPVGDERAGCVGEVAQEEEGSAWGECGWHFLVFILVVVVSLE